MVLTFLLLLSSSQEFSLPPQVKHFNEESYYICSCLIVVPTVLSAQIRLVVPCLTVAFLHAVFVSIFLVNEFLELSQASNVLGY